MLGKYNKELSDLVKKDKLNLNKGIIANKDLEKNIYLSNKNHLINLNILNFVNNSKYNFKDFSEISVASGVVVDSNANHEFSENYIKAKALIDLFKWFT